MEGMKPYATDSKYKDKVLDIVKRFGLSELLELANKKTDKHETVPSKIEGNIKIKRTSKVPWHTGGIPDRWTTSSLGERVSLNSMDTERRFQTVEEKMNKIRLSPEGFEEFQKNVEDISPEVKARYKNFNGSLNGLGSFASPEEIDHDVWHYTATESEPSVPAIKAANSMNNSQDKNGKNRGVGCHGYISKKGKPTIMTTDKVGHVKGQNRTTWGVETEAKSQEDVDTLQYETRIYWSIDEAVRYFKIKRNMSDTQIAAALDKWARGHGEFAYPNDHTDFPSAVMDPLRALMKEFVINHKQQVFDIISRYPRIAKVSLNGQSQFSTFDVLQSLKGQ